MLIRMYVDADKALEKGTNSGEFKFSSDYMI